MRKILFTYIALLCATLSNAQIGYQVALLNTATGEPRANETVTCEIKLTNSEGGVVYEGTKKATSNDFGVVSLTVGNANTFAQMDWSKLPLYISVSVEGRLVGQTEVLTVPVAEHAKHYGTLTYENIGSKKIISNWEVRYSIEGRTISRGWTEGGGSYSGSYYIDGNTVVGYINRIGSGKETFVGIYVPEIDSIIIQ